MAWGNQDFTGRLTAHASQCSITSAANRVQVSYRGPGLGDSLFR
jgi:hypothetical protein